MAESLDCSPSAAPKPAARHSVVGWQDEIRHSLTSLQELVQAGLMGPQDLQELGALAHTYRFALPRGYAALIRPQLGHRCPIFRQAVPAPSEADTMLPPWAQKLSERAYGRAAPWQEDAIGDLVHLAAPRLTHRYGSRALLHTTSACALYCRFCFRKGHLKSQDRSLYGGALTPALDYLAAHPEVDELILTGGDPLSMGDRWLSQLMGKLSGLHNLRTIRLHSRMATTLPSRLTEGLLQALQQRGPHQQVVLVSHFNHPWELTPEALAALKRFRQSDVLLLNQSTLLHGVNDCVKVLEALCQSLWHAGVLPYYLHHPDWTPGTFAFRVTIDRGRALMAALQGRISGPAVPSYVLDVPFGRGKARLMEASVSKVAGPGSWRNDGFIEGGLWQVQPPHTRSPIGEPVLYLDLAAARVDPSPVPL